MKPELLAPAGSMAALIAAVKSGAQAVYLGLDTYTARKRAKNFSLEELAEAVSYCHLRGVKIYLAFNTLISDDEFEEAISLVCEAYLLGIDAVIVQDIGMCSQILSRCPGLSIHASTQMNFYSNNSFIWARELGISRVVLPREWSIKDIKQAVIDCRELGIETEVFIHGAHCVSYSGICLLSTFRGSGHRSGNKGNCAQPCRESVRVYPNLKNISKGPILSVKDRSSLKVFNELIDTGVDSIKIEGRLRDETYVAVVVAVYRRCMEAYLHDIDIIDELDDMEKEILLAYNRGGAFSDHYLTDKNKSDFAAGEYVGKYGIFIGQVMDKNEFQGWINIKSKMELFAGDIVSFRKNNEELLSFPIGKINQTAHDVFNIRGGHPKQLHCISNGTDVYLSSRKEKHYKVLSDLKYGYTDVRIEISFYEDRCVRVIAQCKNYYDKDVRVERRFDVQDDYHGSNLSKDIITRQFSKTGLYPFNIVSVDIEMSEISLPISFINHMRRSVLGDIKEALLYNKRSLNNDNVKCTHQIIDEAETDDFIQENAECVVVEYIDLVSYNGNIDCGADLYIFSAINIININLKQRILQFLDNVDCSYAIRMPLSGKYIESNRIRCEVEAFIKRSKASFKGYFSSVPELCGSPYHLSAQANIMNSFSLSRMIYNGAKSLSLSHEMNSEEFQHFVLKHRSLFSSCAIQLHCYGKIELMYSAYCPMHTCDCCKGSTDNNNVMTLNIGSDASELTMICHCDICSMTILGHSKWIINQEVINLLKNNGLRLYYMIRIINESENEVKDCIVRVRHKYMYNL